MARVLHWTACGLVPSAVLVLEAARVDRRRRDRSAAAWFDSEHTICRLACRVLKSKYTSLHATFLGAGLLCNPDCTGGYYGKHPVTALRDLRHVRVA
jgi:hypothetical protein